MKRKKYMIIETDLINMDEEITSIENFQTGCKINVTLENTFDFIRLLIQHIPEKNYKMPRYYGLYARLFAGIFVPALSNFRILVSR